MSSVGCSLIGHQHRWHHFGSSHQFITEIFSVKLIYHWFLAPIFSITTASILITNCSMPARRPMNEPGIWYGTMRREGYQPGVGSMTKYRESTTQVAYIIPTCLHCVYICADKYAVDLIVGLSLTGASNILGEDMNPVNTSQYCPSRGWQYVPGMYITFAYTMQIRQNPLWFWTKRRCH